MNTEMKIILSVWMCLLTLKNLYEKEIKIMINFLLPSNSNYAKKAILKLLESGILEAYFMFCLIKKFFLIYFILLLGCVVIIRTISWMYKKIRKIYNKKS